MAHWMGLLKVMVDWMWMDDPVVCWMVDWMSMADWKWLEWMTVHCVSLLIILSMHLITGHSFYSCFEFFLFLFLFRIGYLFLISFYM